MGVRLRKPAERLGWYLIAAAMACFSLGDDVFTYYQVVVHNVPFPSAADALYLCGYPFLFAGVVRLSLSARASSSRDASADAAIVALGALAISWQFLMSSYVHDVTLSTFGMLVNVAYPVMDIGLIFIVFRSLLFRRRKLPYQRMLATTLVILFVGDFAYDLLVLHNAYSAGNVVDAFFLVQYVLVGATALHPSVGEPATIEEPVAAAERRVPGAPITIVCGFIPPVILLVATTVGA
ncbi:MAG: hypothetical protein ACRDV0_00370, partial [Acidimicrobiales bacterium]